MKVIEPGEFVTSTIRCPYCKALMEFDKRDVDISRCYSHYLYSLICPECDKGMSLKLADNGEFQLNKED